MAPSEPSPVDGVIAYLDSKGNVEAANAITRLANEVERLRGALLDIAAQIEDGVGVDSSHLRRLATQTRQESTS